MDEIDFLKKLFKIMIILFSAMTGIVLFGTINSKPSKEMILYILIICGGMYLFSIIIYYILKIILTSQFSVKYLNNKDLYRDILNIYPPAIYSFLYNKKIESYTDYTATILYLECKKYLKVDSDGYNIIVLNNDLEGLYEHEKYVMNCIMKNIKFDMADFNKKIIMDLLQLDLIHVIDKKENKVFESIIENTYFQIISLVLITVLILYLAIFHLQIMMDIFMYGTLIGAIIYICKFVFSVVLIIKTEGDQTKIKLTKKGKDTRKYAFGLKKFLGEYTLINEREIGQKELFENYIAYALSLGEAKIVEEFVSNNKEYRTLIYKR